MGVTLVCILFLLIVAAYLFIRRRSNFLERRMSESVDYIGRGFVDTRRRLSRISCSALASDLRKRSIQTCGDVTSSLATKLSQLRKSGSMFEVKGHNVFGEPPNIKNSLSNNTAGGEASTEQRFENSETGDQPLNVERPENDDVNDTELLDIIRADSRHVPRSLSENASFEGQDTKQSKFMPDNTTTSDSECQIPADPVPKTAEIKQDVESNLGPLKEMETLQLPQVSVLPTIKLDTCPSEGSRKQHTRSVSNEEVVVPVTTYNTVSTRRMSLKPGSVPFHQVTAKRGSVVLPASTISPASRRKSIVVQPQGYVCPRRTSVLFSSDIFAHSPRRKSSASGRCLQIQDSVPSQSKRFFLPRKSVIKNIICSSWSGSKSSAGGVGSLRTGIRAATSHTGSYYPHRRRSSVAFSNDTSKSNRGFIRNLPTLSEIGQSFARRKSMFKRVLKAQFQGIDSTGSLKADTTRRESRAGLSGFRKQSLCGRRQSTQIPKQKGNYLTGNLTEFKTVFGPKAHEVLTEKFRNHGPLYEITALGQKTVFLFDHKHIEHVRKAEGRYPKHMDFKHLRLYRQRNDLPLGLLMSNGEEWRQQRRMLARLLLGAVSTTRYVPVIDKVAKSIIDIISKNLSEDGIFLPEEDTGNYVIEAFGRILYGRDLQTLEKGTVTELHQFVKTARSNFNDAKQLMILPTCLMLLHPAWKRHNDRWNSLLETTIHQVRQSRGQSHKKNTFCVLSQLLSSGEMTDPEILVNLTDLLLASIDTTANTILWCLYELSRQPTMQDKIVEEFMHSGCSSGSIKLQHLQELSYLKAVVKETLRLHPVGFLTCRTISKPMSIREFNIPQNANVAAAMYVMGRNSDLTYDPETFIPERWITNDTSLDLFYNSVPFGFGPRGCIGRKVAEFEISLFVLHFCRSFRFRLKEQEVIEDNYKLLLVLAKTLELVLEKRA